MKIDRNKIIEEIEKALSKGIENLSIEEVERVKNLIPSVSDELSLTRSKSEVKLLIKVLENLEKTKRERS